MTTHTRLIRKYFGEKDGKPILPPLPLNEKMCLNCRLPMFVADGQIQLVHGHCKKEWKQRQRAIKKGHYGAK